MATRRPDFLAILETLLRHKVEFIAVGGVCAVLHGAPISTFDLDLVHARQPENLQRLLAALESLRAHYRGQGSPRLTPQLSDLASPGHQLLMTTAGPLDLSGEIGAGRGYDELLNHTLEFEVGQGLRIRGLDLETLIKTKEEAGSEKDRMVLSILRRTLEE